MVGWSYGLSVGPGSAITPFDPDEIAGTRLSCPAAVSNNPFASGDKHLQEEREQQAVMSSLNTYRDLGDAVLCAGTRIYDGTGRQLSSRKGVRVIGASVLGGTLRHR